MYGPQGDPKAKPCPLDNISAFIILATFHSKRMLVKAISFPELRDHPHPLQPFYTPTCTLLSGDLVAQSPRAQTLVLRLLCRQSRKRDSSTVATAGTSRYEFRRSSPKDARLVCACARRARTGQQRRDAGRDGRVSRRSRGNYALCTDSGCMASPGTLGDYPWSLREC